LDVDPDDREASISSSQRSGSTAKRAKVDPKSKLVEISRERLEEQRAQTEILSRKADSQAKFQSDLFELLRKTTNFKKV